MHTKQQPCSICLESNLELINASQTDNNNIKWSCKLRFCVPEVDWDEDCFVCQTCRSELDTFCSFRNRCLESYGFYNRIVTHQIDNTETKCTDLQKCLCPLCMTIIKQDGQQKIDYTCYLCNETFNSKPTLINHITSHSSNSCDFCENSFTTKTQLQLHITQIHNKRNKQVVCQFYDKTFTSTSLSEHIRKAHIDGSNKSNGTENVNCFSIQNTKVELDDCKTESVPEYSGMPEDESYECSNDASFPISHEDNESTCPSKPPVEQKIPKAETKPLKNQKQSRKTAFVCEECKSVFVSSKKLISHAIRIHGFDPSVIKPFECDKCESKFSTSSNLLQHKKYHVGKRTHICTFCGKGYITKSDLNTHEKQHLNKREYQCSSCPKTFNTNKDLRSHRLVVHTDPSLWNYVCTFCQKRFPIKSNLDQHMRRHTGEKRFGCHICEKRFVDKIVLQKHIKSHSNFRAFKCEHCSKEYKDNRVLEVHMTKIHGIGNAKIPVRVKKYFCHVCPKSYFAKNKLTRHMFSHTGEKPFVCHICERKFTDKSYVKQHLKSAHNVFDIDDNK